MSRPDPRMTREERQAARDRLDRYCSDVDLDLDRLATLQARQVERDEALYRASSPSPLVWLIAGLLCAVAAVGIVYGLVGIVWFLS